MEEDKDIYFAVRTLHGAGVAFTPPEEFLSWIQEGCGIRLYVVHDENGNSNALFEVISPQKIEAIFKETEAENVKQTGSDGSGNSGAQGDDAGREKSNDGGGGNNQSG